MSLRSKNNAIKTDNNPQALRAKIAIRRNVLAAIGAAEAHVLDAYAGDGHLYREVWHEAASYVGCDLKFYPGDDRLAYVVDNIRLLRTLDLSRFNVVDLDAYGSPWEQVYIVASRRPRLAPGELLGLILTEGQGLKLKMGGMSRALAKLAGMQRHFLPGLGRAQDELLNRALARTATMLGGEIVRRWDATGKTGSQMHYIGLVLRGV